MAAQALGDRPQVRKVGLIVGRSSLLEKSRKYPASLVVAALLHRVDHFGREGGRSRRERFFPAFAVAGTSSAVAGDRPDPAARNPTIASQVAR